MSKILIIAGEASGDNLGAGFVKEMHKIQPDIEFFGLGGDRMAAAGVNLLYHINKLAFLGFWEVVKNIRFIKKVEKDILNYIKASKPEMVVLIDYPGFNLRLAPKLKKLGIKIFYYISPQIWAWGAGRINKIKKCVDMMAVIFSFEEEIYKKANVPVSWVGHPLLDEIKFVSRPNKFYRKNNVKSKDTLIGLFPGSRLQEVKLLLPEMLEALKLMKIGFPGIKGIISQAPGIDNSVYRQIINRSGSDIKILDGSNYDLMAQAKLNFVCSGTATLECAITGTPFFVLYKTSFLTYHIARRLVKTSHIGMVNLIAGKQIVPELIQHDCNAERIAETGLQFLHNPKYCDFIREQLSEIKSKLGEPGAAGRAARLAMEMMDK